MIQLPSGIKIGENQPAFIIAEVGSNWRTPDDCIESIVQAKYAGADAVKFQLFAPNDLYGPGIKQWDAIKHVEENLFVIDYQSPYLNPYWLPKLKEKADRCKIEFLCTAFSPEGYELVNGYVDIHKIASAESSHLRILEKVRTLGKPVILSTGAHGISDVSMALTKLCDLDPVLRRFKADHVVLMYCVADYPAQEVDLSQIHNLKEHFNTKVGYSDHTTDVLCIPQLAAKEGACVIEKHFTAVPEANTPDRPHSLDHAQFKRMVESIRGTYKVPFGPSRMERGMLLRHNRRLIGLRDIEIGETLVEGENFGIYRSLVDEDHAFHPFMVNEVIGKQAKKHIKAGAGIGPGDV